MKDGGYLMAIVKAVAGGNEDGVENLLTSLF
jgi:hypothetical protein